MKNYTVKITGIVEKDVEIMANSENEALDFAFEMVENYDELPFQNANLKELTGEIIQPENDKDIVINHCENCEYYCDICDECIDKKEDLDDNFDEELELRKKMFSAHLEKIIKDTTDYAIELFLG